MTDEQKEDLQFWFYTRIFVDHQPVLPALQAAANEVGVSEAVARQYLTDDERIEAIAGGIQLRTFSRDEADPQGIYVDIEWMMQILHRAGLSGESLWTALSSIYKIPPSVAREEAANIAIVEGE